MILRKDDSLKDRGNSAVSRETSHIQIIQPQALEPLLFTSLSEAPGGPAACCDSQEPHFDKGSKQTLLCTSVLSAWLKPSPLSPDLCSEIAKARARRWRQVLLPYDEQAPGDVCPLLLLFSRTIAACRRQSQRFLPNAQHSLSSFP